MSDYRNDIFDENRDQETYGTYTSGDADYSEYSDRKHSGKKNSRKPSNGMKWRNIIASALVFGLVAGATSYGVNYTANQINPVTASAEASDSTGSTNSGATLTSAAKSSDSSSSGTTSSGTVADVAASAMPSMVTISTMSVQEMQSFFGQTQSYEVEGAGTGIIIAETDDEILIATNNHVIEGATEVSVGFIDETAVEATVKGTDPTTDLAVVSVKISDVSEDTLSQIKVITIGDSDSLELGEQVVAIGNALGYGQSVTSGYVSALDRELELSDGTTTYTSTGLIQTDAAINSGNSGGALLNMNGELIGINEAKSSSSSSGASVDNMGFAIPISKAQSILEDLMNGESKTALSDEERGYLGVNVADVTSEYAEIYGMPEGVCITDVSENGAAQAAGLQKGDIIVAVDGTSVSTSSALSSLLSYSAAGDTVTVTVKRADNGEYKEITAEVTLSSRSDLQ